MKMAESRGEDGISKRGRTAEPIWLRPKGKGKNKAGREADR